MKNVVDSVKTLENSGQDKLKMPFNYSLAESPWEVSAVVSQKSGRGNYTGLASLNP